MGCLICYGQERNYKSGPGIEFICGTCVQHLLKFDQDELRRGHKLAIDLGYPWKARAIESFLIKENINAKTKGHKPNLARKRIMRKARSSRNRKRTKQAA